MDSWQFLQNHRMMFVRELLPLQMMKNTVDFFTPRGGIGGIGDSTFDKL